jgi:hypothetical protein
LLFSLEFDWRETDPNPTTLGIRYLGIQQYTSSSSPTTHFLFLVCLSRFTPHKTKRSKNPILYMFQACTSSSSLSLHTNIFRPDPSLFCSNVAWHKFFTCNNSICQFIHLRFKLLSIVHLLIMKIISILCLSLSVLTAATKNTQLCVRESELPDGKTQVRRIKLCCYFK